MTKVAENTIYAWGQFRASQVPLSVCSASITASNGGGSIALARNCPIPPSRSSLMLKAISCRGVRNISGVMWVSSLDIGVVVGGGEILASCILYGLIPTNLFHWGQHVLLVQRTCCQCDKSFYQRRKVRGTNWKAPTWRLSSQAMTAAMHYSCQHWSNPKSVLLKRFHFIEWGLFPRQRTAAQAALCVPKWVLSDSLNFINTTNLRLPKSHIL